MKSQLIAIVAAVLLVGCGESAPDMSIHDAAKLGDTQAVSQHLDAGADVNVKNAFEWTPLHLAVKERRTETVKLLISKNADVNVIAQGETPLDMVRSAGLVKETEAISKLLRKHGGKTGAELK
ncbi:MAG: ankyrin repeat domain-containing protein [Verrucomicrobiota bacterium]|nr:ankyrin repeat domain-containing protein [Verrucomicrobiota bacterium]